MAIQAYYKFNTDLTTDSSGNGYTLIANSTPTNDIGGRGKCLHTYRLNLKCLYISSTIVAYNVPVTASMLINLIQQPGLNELYTFYSSNTAGLDYMIFGYRDVAGVTYLEVYDATNTSRVALTLSINKWHHLVVTYAGSGDTWQIYLDGVQVLFNGLTGSANHSNGSQTLFGSAFGANHVANALFDECILDTTVYTPAKVKNLYAFYKGAF